MCGLDDATWIGALADAIESASNPDCQKRKVDKGSFVLHWHHGQLLLQDDHPLSGQKVDVLELLLAL